MYGTAKEVNSTSREISNRSMALIRPIMPTWTMSSISSGPRLRNRPAAKRTRDMFISISVLRAYWYSGVPSSSVASWPKNSFDSSRASAGATFDGSVISGMAVVHSAACTVVVMAFPPIWCALAMAGW
ncbi:hypothetical protein SGLAM104S_05522 [Streptomyces glaucescens]